MSSSAKDPSDSPDDTPEVAIDLLGSGYRPPESKGRPGTRSSHHQSFVSDGGDDSWDFPILGDGAGLFDD